MDKLIKALQIFIKYKNKEYPTNCSHDVLEVCGIGKEEISKDDVITLEELGFHWSDEYDSWISFKYGSC